MSIITKCSAVAVFFASLVACDRGGPGEPLPGSEGGYGGSATSGSSGDGGDGGSDPVQRCVTADDCAGDADFSCAWRTCEYGACGVAYADYGTPSHVLGHAFVDTIPGDCQRRACDGNGGTLLINDDNDVGVEFDQCMIATCWNGERITSPAIAGKSCFGPDVCCGGKCDGAGACLLGTCVDDQEQCGANCDRDEVCAYASRRP